MYCITFQPVTKVPRSAMLLLY